MKGELRIIKRYQNRKLYDTYQSCYVTLEEISQIIREGNEIQVIDNKTKNDITYMTQIQLLFDQERKSVNAGDTELLKRVIRAEEGTLTGYIRKLEKEYGAAPEMIEGTPAMNATNNGQASQEHGQAKSVDYNNSMEKEQLANSRNHTYSQGSESGRSMETSSPLN